MTLPFVSYGGSSMISLAYGMGMLLALTRDRPRAELLTNNPHPQMIPSREPGLEMSIHDRRTRWSFSRLAEPAATCFPQKRFANALVRRGIAVDLVTDSRAARYGHSFPAGTIHVVPSATVQGRDRSR